MARRNRRNKREGKTVAKAQRLNSIGATDIRRERGEIVTEDVRYEREDKPGQYVIVGNVDRVQDYLGRYQGQGHISPLQWKAGHMLAKHCNGAEVGVPSQLRPRAASAGSSVDDRVRRLDMIERIGAGAAFCARRRDEAITALGPLAGVALWVCRDGRSAQDWAEREGKPPRDGIAALRLALDTLVLHYGLTRAATMV